MGKPMAVKSIGRHGEDFNFLCFKGLLPVAKQRQRQHLELMEGILSPVAPKASLNSASHLAANAELMVALGLLEDALPDALCA